jgi:RNase adaptor protein for sRNA GlmZ degradation
MNLSDNPDPQPTGLASDLIANRTRAILIVDNCPPDLHRRLSDLCSRPESTVSVLTVEYDVRDDQPEGTEVVRLDTSSPELIEKLVQRRYSHLSQVDARTIAEVSGGNARIAIALAQTVERGDTIAGLSDDELFQRLFRQRQESNNALFLAAQACSLVYSF